MNVLKIATAGSVDDGKSTLIGRLLFETNSITEDKLEALATASKRRGLDYTDLSLLTDGLLAEREQGITIDVAHIYFNTPNRKYIIADTPGHIEYTRNMVTGASNADASMILIDARNGLVEQTRRHFFISQLLGLEQTFICVNKMDLVNFDESVFDKIVAEFKALANSSDLRAGNLHFIPLSSLHGDNLVECSARTPWYKGKSLLELLENVQVEEKAHRAAARLQVQQVIRPKNAEFPDFRGFAGRIASGNFVAGDEIMALPSGKISKIKSLEKFDQKLEVAGAGESITLTLEDEIDISRGSLILKSNQQLASKKQLEATICWMTEAEAQKGKNYLIRHGVHESPMRITEVSSKIDFDKLAFEPTQESLALNDIAKVSIKTAQPIFADSFQENPKNGAFIIIDPADFNTVAVGMVAS